MSGRGDNWMPMFWGDYLRDTSHLTTIEHGAYMLLIGHYWTSGKPLPKDDARLAAITRLGVSTWRKIAATILAFFHDAADGWRHKRIDAELERARRNIEKRSQAGKKGAQSRWQPDGEGNDNRMATAMAMPSPSQWQNDGTPSPSPSDSSLRSESIGGDDRARASPGLAVIAEFDRIGAAVFGERWRAWPNPTDRVIAERWLAAGADLPLCSGVFEAVHRKLAAGKHDPPGSLKFHDRDIANAIKTRDQPMPEGKANGTGNHDDPVRRGRAQIARGLGLDLEHGGAGPGRGSAEA